ncbi:MAG: STAS domain-containing protein [Burkholderiales bacterium]|nr:STAS domain-containing protein [Burkholderiales bacterium]MDE1928509.1 STAS domain-containing protein [Burkholderiales bacterium]MDE2161499.1 STAS domain-containing protein [Burkholderiales bacterium]MDE2502810.1 STAS domain-containing protein [Burkholderiales bacterium]
MPLTLPLELSICTAAETRAACLSWLDRPDPGPVLAAGVEVVDGAGVQLLLALARAAQRRGRDFALADASEALRRACSALGAGALLGAGDVP